MIEPVGITIFCDDIRFEQLNKISLVGCYGPEMIITGELPAVLPKLGIFVQVRLPAGCSTASKVRVYLPDSKEDQPACVIDIASPSDENIIKSNQSFGSDTVTLLATNIPILLSPVMINAEGLIKVRVEWGDKIIKAGTLNVRIAVAEPTILSNASTPPSLQSPNGAQET